MLSIKQKTIKYQIYKIKIINTMNTKTHCNREMHVDFKGHEFTSFTYSTSILHKHFTSDIHVQSMIIMH